MARLKCCSEKVEIFKDRTKEKENYKTAIKPILVKTQTFLTIAQQNFILKTLPNNIEDQYKLFPLTGEGDKIYNQFLNLMRDLANFRETYRISHPKKAIEKENPLVTKVCDLADAY